METPRGNRLHMVIVGCRNAGKSSLINALTGQEVAIVSPLAGTTTDPVVKNMEILPLGPVVLYDTAGLDDDSQLGGQRTARTREVMRRADLAVVVVDGSRGLDSDSRAIIVECGQRGLAMVVAVNKADLTDQSDRLAGLICAEFGCPAVAVSAINGRGLNDLRLAMLRQAPVDWDEQKLVGDIVNNGQTAVLVVPIDLAAPKGRLILPQVQVLRDLLDHDALAVICKERELAATLASLRHPPRLVITDSQVFLKVEADIPPDVMLTSFSVLFARYRGDLPVLLAGAERLLTLRPGDKVLLAEACTHHRTEDDIGRVKLPRWLRQQAGGEIQLGWSSGNTFPADLAGYDLIIHCGGCMINRREMLWRIWQAREAGVPITNYGLAIAALQGILDRAVQPFAGPAKTW
ncbi:MAG: [FeFe] hydrogenase H-cluster maturation GTPase HydF [Negativicutes bacterium]|nr:[FeFe] hydrogenase H-cluster maturation GTPase HydF [Negativicutes bacterium]